MDWRGILSGQRQDLPARLMRVTTHALSQVYRWVVIRRNRRFDQQRTEIRRVNVPVISVGNLTAGGTGKTPLVIWLCQTLQQLGLRPAIVSRGYGGQGDALNDEGREIRLRLPDVPVIQNRQRAEGAQVAIDQHGANVIVLDDGFQHRRLHRDLDLVLIDATCPWGYGYVLPRGLLREPIEGLRRADAVILTRRNLVSDQVVVDVRQVCAKLQPDVPWIESEHAPTCLLTVDGETKPLESLIGSRVYAFCAIGNPQAFRSTLEGLGAEVIGMRIFADHHVYTDEELRSVSEAARQAGAAQLVCTQKDWVKLRYDPFAGVELSALRVDFRITAGAEDLLALIRR